MYLSILIITINNTITQLSQKYIVQKPMFINFPAGTFEGLYGQ